MKMKGFKSGFKSGFKCSIPLAYMPDGSKRELAHLGIVFETLYCARCTGCLKHNRAEWKCHVLPWATKLYGKRFASTNIALVKEEKYKS